MGIKSRVPKSTRDRQNIKEIENKFIGDTEKDNLSSLSLKELADAFESIEQQAQLLQGRILLEARGRFESDISFGAWIKESGSTLCATSHQHRTRLMNLARFFENRQLDKISITAAYEISAPINADVADKVYQAALNQNLSVAQIKAEIAKAKGLLPESVNEGSGEPELMPLEDISRFMEQVLGYIAQLPKQDAMRVLKTCIKEINKKE